MIGNLGGSMRVLMPAALLIAVLLGVQRQSWPTAGDVSSTQDLAKDEDGDLANAWAVELHQEDALPAPKLQSTVRQIQ
jgi:hypothetical protein